MERIRGVATGPLLSPRCGLLAPGLLPPPLSGLWHPAWPLLLLGPHGLQRELWKITLVTFPLVISAFA